MKTLITRIGLTLCMLLAVGPAWTATSADPNNLAGERAMVQSVDDTAYTIVLRVPSLANPTVTFAVSPNCTYSNGLATLSNVLPNSRILVWTEAPREGTLPVIVKMARAEY